jgi:hypothetical protein
VYNIYILLASITTMYLIKSTTEKSDPGEQEGAVKIPFKCVFFINNFLRCLVLIFTFLLFSGACVSAYVASFGPRGKLLQVDGQTFHVYCDGPKNESLPVVWLLSSDAHGVVDFYGLQYFLTQKGLRLVNNISHALMVVI